MNIPSPARVFRHLFLDQSSERHYPPALWERKYAVENYEEEVSSPKEDGRFGALLALIRRYDRGGPLLDAGCADGTLWARYRPLSSSKLYGIDFAPTAIDKARGRDIPDASFDLQDYRTYRPPELCSLIVFNESLYYADNYLEVLGNMEGALKPGGLLIVSMWSNAITKRMWRKLATVYNAIHAVQVSDETTDNHWRIVVFPSRAVST
jgi:trans-aconitate methyltransferase